MATLAAIDPDAGSKNTRQLENTEKRDTLIVLEKKYQKQWQDSHVFEQDAPSITDIPFGTLSSAEIREKHPKQYATMAYPYMNGVLHAGHSFTASKVEFATGYARMEGKRALFPQGWHCTGMPIKACADKLVDEVKKFGKNFERYDEDAEAEAEEANGEAKGPAATKEDVTKFSGKKSKAVGKTVKLKYQFQIMLAQPIPKEEIHKFAEPEYWLEYFPPLAEKDLNDFGARVDWRRQMVTTDANPYYDAFVRWQMNRLHEMKKILYGNRYTIYSPKDGQPCMDHDRTEGEGVGPQEYTALKLKVLEWAEKAGERVKGLIPEDASVFFIPATLRPETMYGQTCCFVGPKIIYGIFKVSEEEYYVATKRAAWNMAFQGTFFESEHFPRDQSELKPVVELPGSVFVGTLVHAPLSVHKAGVRILPMDTVLATKGTGVVTSVPSDSPDDYATVVDLAKKADYYGIKKEWAELEIPPIIETPSYGNLTAPTLVKKMKINSPKDATQLAEAKDLAYTEGFYKGKMLIGEFKGESVQTAKEKVRESLIKSGEAFPFADPNGRVISRSSDECVVAFLGQWFLNYGQEDAEWQQSVMDWVSNGLNTYIPETRNQFEANLDWLNRWACARTYGLGSKLPWDPKFLVESLSDSTIYMAYYTISHLLHADRYGQNVGPLHIKPEQMIDEVWDYIFTRRDLSDDLIKSSGISKESLHTMRREFEYWYPLDCRISGKDLIPNHLTFFLYIHLAIFPKEFWPRGVRANGHIQVNGEKMSKSKGNFLTLAAAVKKYGADATRIAMADAGDGIEDANFDERVADTSILRLFTLKEWCEETVKDKTLRTGPADAFWDKLFENEMNTLVHEARTHYENTDYKLALKSSLYDFQSTRDFYREATASAGIGMHRNLILRYIELQALLITPIAPHWAEYAWREILEKSTSIQTALYPSVPIPSAALTASHAYIRATSSAIGSAEGAANKKASKGKATAFDPRKPKNLTIFCALTYPAWQDKYIELVREYFDSTTLTTNDKELNPKVAKGGEAKKAMPFVQGLKKRLAAGEKADMVFQRKLAFDEVQVLMEMRAGLVRTTGCKGIDVVIVDEGAKTGTTVEGEPRKGLPPVAESATPGNPSFHFENVEG